MHPDPTEIDPDGHLVVFENEHVRILEIKSAQGTHLPMHTHVPRVIVAIEPYRIRSIEEDGGTTVLDRRPGQASWSETENHAADILVGPTHVIEIEVKSAAPPTSADG